MHGQCGALATPLFRSLVFVMGPLLNVLYYDLDMALLVSISFVMSSTHRHTSVTLTRANNINELLRAGRRRGGNVFKVTDVPGLIIVSGLNLRLGEEEERQRTLNSFINAVFYIIITLSRF